MEPLSQYPAHLGQGSGISQIFVLTLVTSSVLSTCWQELKV